MAAFAVFLPPPHARDAMGRSSVWCVPPHPPHVAHVQLALAPPRSAAPMLMAAPLQMAVRRKVANPAPQVGGKPARARRQSRVQVALPPNEVYVLSELGFDDMAKLVWLGALLTAVSNFMSTTSSNALLEVSPRGGGVGVTRLSAVANGPATAGPLPFQHKQTVPTPLRPASPRCSPAVLLACRTTRRGWRAA